MIWLEVSKLDWEKVPAEYQLWFREQHSLTQQLQRAAAGHPLTIEIINNQWMPTDFSICGNLTKDSRCWMREIRFLCAGVPWEWAETWIPEKTFSAGDGVLQKLGVQSLGTLLFSDQHPASREKVEVALIESDHPFYVKATNALNYFPEKIWIRRSWFRFYGEPLLVYEALVVDRIFTK